MDANKTRPADDLSATKQGMANAFPQDKCLCVKEISDTFVLSSLSDNDFSLQQRAGLMRLRNRNTNNVGGTDGVRVTNIVSDEPTKTCVERKGGLRDASNVSFAYFFEVRRSTTQRSRTCHRRIAHVVEVDEQRQSIESDRRVWSSRNLSTALQ